MNPAPAALVTVDVEPDNVWADHTSTSFDNLRGLERFDRSCSDHGVSPTYLVTYSALMDPIAMATITQLAENREIGAHPHLWEIPPITDSDRKRATVAGDHTIDVLSEKVGAITNLLADRVGPAKSHRAGRWYLDERQVPILADLGYEVDTSVTPGIDWSSSGGPDYRDASADPWRLGAAGAVLEVPCTVRRGHRFAGLESTRPGRALFSRLGLGPRWLRCLPGTPVSALMATNAWALRTRGHVNVTTHSSELTAGTSPYWRTAGEVERHFESYELLFRSWTAAGTHATTLREFAQSWTHSESDL